MSGTWVSVILLLGVGLGGGCSRKKAEPAPSSAPAMSAEAHDKTGKDAGGAMDAVPTASGAMDTGPTAAAPEPGPTEPLKHPPGERVPIESLFEVMYTPDEALPEQLRRRIRFRLKDKSRAPIALHHIIDIPKPDGSREVFALYESSVYEDCVQGYANRKEGREHCLGEFVDVFDGEREPTAEEKRRDDGRYRYRTKQIRLNRDCVALGAVRAVFGPPGPGETAETGGSLAITSIAFTDALCKVDSYNRLLVADIDGDQKLELYVDITTAREELGEVRGPGMSILPKAMYNSHRHLYILSGNNIANAELSIDLDNTTPPSNPVPPELIEFRDVDRDGHLDVIETKPCYWMPGPGEFVPCESAPEAMHFSGNKRIAYLYDVEQDAYKEGVAMEAPTEKAAPAVAPSPTQQGAEAAAPAPEAATPAPVPSDASRTVPQEAPAKARSGEAPAKASAGGGPVHVPAGGAPARP